MQGPEVEQISDREPSATRDKVSVPDWHAAIFHLLGLRHDGVVYHRNGLEERLTGVNPARVVKEILA